MRMRCPKCDSPEVACLPNNGITRNPGYKCKGCGLTMRPKGTVVMYAAILVLGLAVAVFFTLPWFDPQAERLPIGIPVAGAGVALFSVFQLMRPAPKQVEDDSPA